jgi:ribosomal protein S18 acetylase RimI-like enzyme
MAPIALTIRPAIPDDAPEVLKLVNRAYRGDSSRAGWTTEADLVGDQRIDLEGVLVKINDPSGKLLVAYDEAGQLASCCEIRRPEGKHVGYFGMFAVDPLRQGGGIGRQVMMAAEKYGKETLDLNRLEMTVIWTRKELMEWYERLGYHKTGEKRPFPYHDPTQGRPLRDDLYFEVIVKDI